MNRALRFGGLFIAAILVLESGVYLWASRKTTWVYGRSYGGAVMIDVPRRATEAELAHGVASSR